jgi:serine/threonine protein kinase
LGQKHSFPHRSPESSADNVAPTHNLSKGQIVGDRYEIKSMIGQGGMGSVYLVQQIFLQKEFALKTLNPVDMSDTAWRRFQKEAQATSALDHPSLIKVYDFGMIDDSQPFFVMDYFEGETLANRIEKSGALSLEDAMTVFTHVCSALEHAHKQGVIHRDIKPSNIMIAPEGLSDYQVRLVDFGIAKLTSADHESLGLTRTGEVFGTPYYMSPEQCLGTAIDHRADIYSLGCVLFQTLTGMPPFIGDTALSIMMQHQSAMPVSLQEASLGKNFPEAADRVVRKMLQKKPEDRYQNLRDLGRDFEAIKLGQRVLSQKNAALARKPRVQKNVLLGIGAIVAVSALSFLIGRTTNSPRNNATPTSQQTNNGDSVSNTSVGQRDQASQSSTQPVSQGSEFYSTFSDKNKRTFHFGNKDKQAPGIMILPKGVDCLTAEATLDGKKKVYATGEVVINNFQPFALIVSDNAEANPDLLGRFRPDEVSALIMTSPMGEVFSDKAVAKCTKLTSIVRVKIENSKDVTDASLDYLNQLPNLTELCLSKTAVTGASVGKLRNLHKFRVLDVSSFRPQSGGAALAALAGSTNIQSLNLRRGGLMNDKVVQSIKSLVNLQNLDLSGTVITDSQLAELAELKHLKELDVLDCPNITVKSFETLTKFPALKYLTIGRTQPNDFTAQLPKLTKLLANRCEVRFSR